MECGKPGLLNQEVQSRVGELTAMIQFVLAPLLLHVAVSAAFYAHDALFEETGRVVCSTSPSEQNLLVWRHDGVVMFLLVNSVALGGYIGYLFGWEVGFVVMLIGLGLGKPLEQHVLSDAFSMSLLRRHRSISAGLLLLILYNLWSIWPI